MLISAIRDEIIVEVGGDTADTDLQTIVLQMINSAVRRFPRFARSRMLKTVKSGTLSAAALTMTLPSGTRQIEQVYYLDSSSGRRINIEMPKDVRRFNECYRANETGTPQMVRIYGVTVEFDRKNDAERTIYFECTKDHGAVIAGDTWAFSDDEAEILKDGAKWYYHEQKEDWEAAGTKKGDFKAGLDRLTIDNEREATPGHVEEAEE